MVLTAIIVLSITNHRISISEAQLQFDISVSLSQYWDESFLGVRNDASDSFDINWDIIDTPPPLEGSSVIISIQIILQTLSILEDFQPVGYRPRPPQRVPRLLHPVAGA